jgi:hypothetical protein
MCLVIDANVVAEVFSADPSEAGRRVLSWLSDGKGITVYGGEQARELFTNHAARSWFAEAVRAGRARLVLEKDIESARERIQSSGAVESDDIHVLSLAAAAGARLLFTRDNLLARDFKDRRIIVGGSVYREHTHGHLLRRDRCAIRS